MSFIERVQEIWNINCKHRSRGSYEFFADRMSKELHIYTERIISHYLIFKIKLSH